MGIIEKVILIYEFNGCYVHGCLKCYPKRNEISSITKKTHQENYDNTIKKIRIYTVKRI